MNISPFDMYRKEMNLNSLQWCCFTSGWAADTIQDSFPQDSLSSVRELAQGGPVYICRDQRKCVFHNMGHLMHNCVFFVVLSRTLGSE